MFTCFSAACSENAAASIIAVHSAYMKPGVSLSFLPVKIVTVFFSCTTKASSTSRTYKRMPIMSNNNVDSERPVFDAEVPQLRDEADVCRISCIKHPRHKHAIDSCGYSAWNK